MDYAIKYPESKKATLEERMLANEFKVDTMKAKR